MHFGSPGDMGGTFGQVRAALEFTFLNSAVDSNGGCLALLDSFTHMPVASAINSGTAPATLSCWGSHMPLVSATLHGRSPGALM